MKLSSRIFNCFHRVLILLGIPLLILSAANASGEVWKTITPTEVYYLAKSIDDSLASMYGLTTTLTKKRISNNLRPRNVYQKVLSVADEFNILHDNAVSSFKLNEARGIDASRTNPSDVYAVLALLKEYLVSKDTFTESTEERSPKTPGDVFHILRQISMHHLEIAKKKNISTDWATPAQVYDSVVTGILPVVYKIAAEAGVEHEYYPFPSQPVSRILPRYVYKLLYHVYKNISEYYLGKGGYDPVILVEVNDCDKISPADVFDLTKVVIAELRAKSGSKTLPSEIAVRYGRWKNTKEKIVPGDVFRLIQHNFILTKSILRRSVDG
ncbi:hypothetical protein QUF72_03970 [Desulfobacterales bacterium HSG2]|nr:hypothetical protein [Desulfobacterales bacterium HSG2]